MVSRPVRTVVLRGFTTGNPLGPSTGNDRVVRGGSFQDPGNAYRRLHLPTSFRFFHTGFRVVRKLER
jgi:hypothetical protein